MQALLAVAVALQTSSVVTPSVGSVGAGSRVDSSGSHVRLLAWQPAQAPGSACATAAVATNAGPALVHQQGGAGATDPPHKPDSKGSRGGRCSGGGEKLSGGGWQLVQVLEAQSVSG